MSGNYDDQPPACRDFCTQLKIWRDITMKSFIKSAMLLSGLALGGQAFAAHTCTATPSNTGGNFFQVDVSVTNTGTTALSSWTVTLNFPEQITPVAEWNV